MAIVFAVRGGASPYSARYSSGGKTPMAFLPTSITTQAEGLSGTVFDLDGAGVKYLSYSGYKNTPNGRNHSILIRMAPQYTGSPAANQCIWSLSVGPGTTCAYLELRHLTNGTLTLLSKNELGATAINLSLGSWSPSSGTYYDILVTWDGTTTANAVKGYVDASLLGQGTAAAALTSSWNNTYWRSVIIGYGPNITATTMYVDEFVIWDTVIDGTANVDLVGGADLLDGASRTALVDVAEFDGTVNVDPGVAKVEDGTAYTIEGVALTGTSSVLSTATIAAAVWDRTTSSHTTAGTYGVLIKKLLKFSQFLGLK